MIAKLKITQTICYIGIAVWILFLLLIDFSTLTDWSSLPDKAVVIALLMPIPVLSGIDAVYRMGLRRSSQKSRSDAVWHGIIVCSVSLALLLLLNLLFYGYKSGGLLG